MSDEIQLTFKGVPIVFDNLTSKLITPAEYQWEQQSGYIFLGSSCFCGNCHSQVFLFGCSNDECYNFGIEGEDAYRMCCGDVCDMCKTDDDLDAKPIEWFATPQYLEVLNQKAKWLKDQLFDPYKN